MVPYFRKPHNRNERTSVLLIILFGMLAIIVIGFLVNLNWKLYKKRVVAEKQTILLRDEITKLEEQVGKLEEDLDKIGTPEYLEKTARERLNLKKPREKVVAVIVPESEKAEADNQQKKTWWQKILEKIGL